MYKYKVYRCNNEHFCDLQHVRYERSKQYGEY